MQTLSKSRKKRVSTSDEQLFVSGGAARNRSLRTFFCLTVLLMALALLSGCGSPGAGNSATNEPGGVQNSQDGKEALEEVIRANLTEETAKTISEIKVNQIGGAYSVTIRTIAVGGLYIPDVIEQTAQAVFDKAEDMGLTMNYYEVTEYSESNSEGITNMIAWRSNDGVTGTYSDDTGDEPFVKANATLDDVRGIVE